VAHTMHSSNVLLIPQYVVVRVHMLW